MTAVSVGWDGVCKVWNLTSFERKAVLRGHEASVQDVKISSDASRIVSVDLKGLVCVFEGNAQWFDIINLK